MRIGDTPHFSGMHEVKGSNWDNEDRALLNHLLGEMESATMRMNSSYMSYREPQESIKKAVTEFKGFYEKCKNLIDKLPPGVHRQFDEILGKLDETFKDVLNPEKNGEAADKLFKEVLSLEESLKDWI